MKHSRHAYAYALIAGLALAGNVFSQTIPETFDLRDIDGHSYIGQARDQGYVGTCYAFGALAAAESTYNRATGRYDEATADFSESFIVWSLSPLYEGFSGGIDGASDAYDELKALVDHGVCDESVFPYTETDPGADNLHWDAPRVQFSSWHRLPAYDIETMKRALLAGGAIDTGIVADSVFGRYTTGVLRSDDTATDGIVDYEAGANHAVAIVGWDDTPTAGGDGAWIVRNSWGPNWGESGYLRMDYHAERISTNAAYLTYGDWTGDDFDTRLTGEIEATPTAAGGITQSNGFYAWGGNKARLVNEALVTSIAEAETGDSFSHGLFLWGGAEARLENSSTVRSTAIADTGLATAYGLCFQGQRLINSGDVAARAISSGDQRATAYGARFFSFDSTSRFNNSGLISARADGSNAWAIGAQIDDARSATNTGAITADGTTRATGLIACNVGIVENHGDIAAFSSTGQSVGIYLEKSGLRNHAGATITAQNNSATAYGLLATDSVVLNNGTISGQAHQLTDSMLGGSGVFNGTLNLTRCTILPGEHSIGQLTINGDLASSGGLSLQIEIDTEGYDQVHVTGKATLDGANTLALRSRGYMPAGEYTFISADGATGTFSLGRLPIMYEGTVTAGATGFLLDLDRHSYADFSNRPDLAALGASLDTLRPAAPGTVAAMLDLIDSADETAQIGQAVIELQPSINATASASAIQSVHRTGAQIADHAQNTPRSNRTAAFGASAWFSLLDGRERRAATTGFSAARDNTDGDMVGIEFSPGRHFTLGAAYADARQYVTDLDDPAHARIDSHRGYLYGRWAQRDDATGWAANAHLGLGSSRIQTSRTVAFLDAVHEGAHRARDTSAALGTSYGFHHRIWTLRPFLDAEFVRLDERAYTETGYSGAELTFPKQHDTSFLGGAGLALSARLGLGRFAIIPEASVRQARDFSAGSRGLAAAFDGGEVFLAPGRDLPTEQTDVSFALRAQFADRLAASLRYTHTGYSSGHDYAETVAGQLHYTF